MVRTSRHSSPQNVEYMNFYNIPIFCNYSTFLIALLTREMATTERKLFTLIL